MFIEKQLTHSVSKMGKLTEPSLQCYQKIINKQKSTNNQLYVYDPSICFFGDSSWKSKDAFVTIIDNILNRLINGTYCLTCLFLLILLVGIAKISLQSKC